MSIPANEYRIWVDGRPSSSQGKGRLTRLEYVERIQEAARAMFTTPITVPVEITIVFKNWDTRPDVDNVEKRAIDALKGIAIVDDGQVRKATKATIDEGIIDIIGDDHLTFAQILTGDQVLIRILVDPEPTIAWEVKSS